MNLSEIFAECEAKDIELLGEGGNLIVQGPRGSITETFLARVREHKALLLDRLASGHQIPGLDAGEPQVPEPPPDWVRFCLGKEVPRDFLEAADYYAGAMLLEDAYHAQQRPDQTPCPWCGGRGGRHTEACRELHESWVVLPFKKYRGKPVAAVAKSDPDYLRVILKKCRLAPELRAEIHRVLGLPPPWPPASEPGVGGETAAASNVFDPGGKRCAPLPGWLRDWCLLLESSDIPAGFRMNPWTTITSPSIYLQHLRRRVRDYPRGADADVLLEELEELHRVLLDPLLGRKSDRGSVEYGPGTIELQDEA